MRLVALQSLMNRQLATYQVSRSRHDLLVSKRPSRCSPFCRPPLRLHSMGSSSHDLYLLFRVRFRTKSVVHADMLNAFLEVSLSIATSPRRIHSSVSFLALTYVPLSVFLPLSAVFSSSELPGLFHPGATCEICFPGVFPATKRPRLIAASLHALFGLAKFVYCEVALTAPTFPAAHSRLCS
jgi:hypothetical protein